MLTLTSCVFLIMYCLTEYAPPTSIMRVSDVGMAVVVCML